MQAERVCILYYVFVCVCVCVCFCATQSLWITLAIQKLNSSFLCMASINTLTAAEQVMNFMADPIQCDYFKYLAFCVSSTLSNYLQCSKALKH